MLSIGSMTHGQGGYYIEMARENYYLAGGEPPGVWMGEGAERIGLAGAVERKPFLDTFVGFDPGTGAPLVQNAGVTDGKFPRQPGWDLSFSAPKSVSLVWALADQRTQRAIQLAQSAAVNEALRYLQDEHAYIRRGKGGVVREKALLIVAAFEHGTSRAQDPQLHTHAVLLNAAIGLETGRSGAMESKPIFRAKMAAGALYRAELACRLAEMGFAIERTGRRGELFEIVGVPAGLQREASKRRQEIEALLDARGQTGAVAAANAALLTRVPKEHVPRSALFTNWREIGKNRYDFGNREAEALRWTAAATRSPGGGSPKFPRQFTEEEQRHSLMTAVRARLTREFSHFSEHDMLRAAAEIAPGRTQAAETDTFGGFGIARLRQIVREELRSAVPASTLAASESVSATEAGDLHRGFPPGISPNASRPLVFVGEQKVPGHWQAERRYTTPELWDTERKMLADAERLRSTPFRPDHRPPSEDDLRTARESAEGQVTRRLRERDPAVAAVFRMNDEQQEALRHLTDGRSRLAIVTGIAGSGKTAALTAAREVWEENGCTVIGTAVSALVARALEEGPAGLSGGMTLTRLLKAVDANTQTSRANSPGSGVVLNESTVVVVDEAGMVGTRQMAALTDAAQKSGAKLALIGEERQLQPVEVGGPFRSIRLRGKIGETGDISGIGDTVTMPPQRADINPVQSHDGGRSIPSYARLTTIVRQALDLEDPFGNPAWRREAVTALAEGRAKAALTAHQERGMLHIAETRREAIQAIVDSWRQEGGSRLPKDNLILAGTRSEVRELNQLAQDARREEGRLGMRAARMTHFTYQDVERQEGLEITTIGKDAALREVSERTAVTIRERDRVLFTRNHRDLSGGVGVSNGDQGAVVRIDLKEELMTVRLDAQRGARTSRSSSSSIPPTEVTFAYKDFHDLTFGYAQTVHKAQGTTAKNVYALAGGPVADREMSYVQGSRAQNDTRWFTERIHVVDSISGRWVDRTVDELSRRMSHSRQKDLAHDIADAAKEGLSEGVGMADMPSGLDVPEGQDTRDVRALRTEFSPPGSATKSRFGRDAGRPDDPRSVVEAAVRNYDSRPAKQDGSGADAVDEPPETVSAATRRENGRGPGRVVDPEVYLEESRYANPSTSGAFASSGRNRETDRHASPDIHPINGPGEDIDVIDDIDDGHGF